MIIKNRSKPDELLKLEALQGRVAFTYEQQRIQQSLATGLTGEFYFDALAQEIDDAVICLNDLLVISGGRTCQIDALFIANGTLYLFEIKNWEGSFAIENGDFVGLSACPLAQLKRTTLILVNLLRGLGIDVMVESRLIFMNPKITVYGIQRESPILFVHQLPHYFQEISKHGAWTERDHQVGNMLLNQHISHNPYRKEIAYSWESVSGGILCPHCRLKMRSHDLLKLSCCRCKFVELKKDGLKRTKDELDILFEKSLYPARDLHLWCEGLISKRMIQTFITQRYMEN